MDAHRKLANGEKSDEKKKDFKDKFFQGRMKGVKLSRLKQVTIKNQLKLFECETTIRKLKK